MLEISATSGFGLLQTSGQSKPGSAQEQLLARIQRENPDKADALKRQLEDSKSVLAQMEAMKRNMRQAPKADAAQRVARIKEEIRMLKMMGGDPKTVARRIAHLARELGQAAKAYAAAGSGADASAAASGGAGTTASTASGTTANGNGAAANSAGATAIAATNTTATATPTADSAGGEESGAENADANAASPQAGTAAGEDTTLADYRQSRLDDLQAKLADTAARAGEADSDRKFRDEVRDLIAKLKELARKTARELKEEGDDNNPDIAAAKQSLNEAEKAAAQIDSQTAAIASGASLSVFA